MAYQIYRPSWRAFAGAMTLSVSPAVVAGIVAALAWANFNWIGQALTGVSLIFSAYLILQTLFVFSHKAVVHPAGFAVTSPLGGMGIQWDEVDRAVLRERVNAVTRTDHLLILAGPTKKVAFNSSILAPRDEEVLLDMVRRHVPVHVQRDKASL